MSETQKAKTLFDHLNNITAIQDPEYFNKLTDSNYTSYGSSYDTLYDDDTNYVGGNNNASVNLNNTNFSL
mgnify:CR=1 FL=1